MSRLTDILLKNADAILRRINIYGVEGKTILVTGASGLLGVHILACLKQAKDKKRINDCNVIGVVHREPLTFVKEMCGKKTVLLQGDLTDINFLYQLPQADIIIHAASYGQPIRFMEDPIKTLKLNTLTTYLLFDKLLPEGKFLFISSSELYIGLTEPPFKEREIGMLNTDHPRACYVEAKRCGESIVNAYRGNGIDAKSIRLSAAYGPGTRLGDKRVISSFIQKALEGEIQLMDQGRAIRAYCYVTDVVELMWTILFKGKEAIYNVGANVPNTIAEVATTIGKSLQVPVVFPEITEEISGSPKESWLDLSKVENEFHKTEYVSIEDGINQTIAWYRILQQEKEQRE